MPNARTQNARSTRAADNQPSLFELEAVLPRAQRSLAKAAKQSKPSGRMKEREWPSMDVRFVTELDMPDYPTDLARAVDRAINDLPRDQLWFTYQDIRHYFGVSRATVARRLREGLVPGVSMVGHGVLEGSSVRRFDRVQLHWLLLSIRYRRRQSTPELPR